MMKGEFYNLGLPQGFVRFGTNYHKVLKLLHVHGKLSMPDIAAELPKIDRRSLSTAIKALRKNGFIFRVGTAHAYETGEVRSAAIFDLKKTTRWVGRGKATPAERQARMRDKQRARIPSIFDIGHHNFTIKL
jgi:biotin operon repressor